MAIGCLVYSRLFVQASMGGLLVVAPRTQLIPAQQLLRHFCVCLPGAPQWVVPVAACLTYSIASMATTFANKAVTYYFHFDFPIFLTVYQVC